VSDPVLESTRRRLTAKQADTVDRLGRAAVELLRREGFAGLTVRRVAAEAGVGAATAYTYFSSKEEIFAEVVTALVADFRAIAHTEPRSGDGPAARIARANRAYLMAYQANAAMMAVLEQAGKLDALLGRGDALAGAGDGPRS